MIIRPRFFTILIIFSYTLFCPPTVGVARVNKSIIKISTEDSLNFELNTNLKVIKNSIEHIEMQHKIIQIQNQLYEKNNRSDKIVR